MGIGTFGQVKSIADAAKLSFNVPIIVTAIILTTIVSLVTLGGIKRISKVSEAIVPFMAGMYIVGVLMVLAVNIKLIPQTIMLIIESAFNPRAAFGGVTGITILMVMQRGIGRGVFSNEAGFKWSNGWWTNVLH